MRTETFCCLDFVNVSFYTYTRESTPDFFKRNAIKTTNTETAATTTKQYDLAFESFSRQQNPLHGHFHWCRAHVVSATGDSSLAGRN